MKLHLAPECAQTEKVRAQYAELTAGERQCAQQANPSDVVEGMLICNGKTPEGECGLEIVRPDVICIDSIVNLLSDK